MIANFSVQRLHPAAQLPSYATDGSAAMDFYAVGDATLLPNCSLTLGLGVAVEVPQGFGLVMLSRSGHGFNFDVRLANCVGLIDSDYRGEVMVRLTSDGTSRLNIRAGDRIVQGVLLPLLRATPRWADSLSTTARGKGGLGSTGA